MKCTVGRRVSTRGDGRRVREKSVLVKNERRDTHVDAPPSVRASLPGMSSLTSVAAVMALVHDDTIDVNRRSA
jgi:hypothetical protein